MVAFQRWPARAQHYHRSDRCAATDPDPELDCGVEEEIESLSFRKPRFAVEESAIVCSGYAAGEKQIPRYASEWTSDASRYDSARSTCRWRRGLRPPLDDSARASPSRA